MPCIHRGIVGRRCAGMPLSDAATVVPAVADTRGSRGALGSVACAARDKAVLQPLVVISAWARSSTSPTRPGRPFAIMIDRNDAVQILSPAARRGQYESG